MSSGEVQWVWKHVAATGMSLGRGPVLWRIETSCFKIINLAGAEGTACFRCTRPKAKAQAAGGLCPTLPMHGNAATLAARPPSRPRPPVARGPLEGHVPN